MIFFHSGPHTKDTKVTKNFLVHGDVVPFVTVV
jgi:hypothetical protein